VTLTIAKDFRRIVLIVSDFTDRKLAGQQTSNERLFTS
jgi:hypothetical protein